MKRCLLLLMLVGCSTTVQPPAPSAPALMSAKPGLTAASKSYAIQLSWLPYTDPSASYLKVYQGTSPTSFGYVQQVAKTLTTTQVGGLGYNVQYYFRMTAFGPNGESAPSTTCSYFKQNANKPGIPGTSAQ